MREPGFYWVIIDSSRGWEIAEYTEHKNWFLVGCELTHHEAEFLQINELPIMSHNARIVDGFEENYI